MSERASEADGRNPRRGGRLQGTPLLPRVEGFCQRVLDVVEELQKQQVSFRVIDQLLGSGTAVGANLFEADEALSRRDFRKCVAIAVKELNETRFWLRLIAGRDWIRSDRLRPLEAEAGELKRILGAILERSRER